MSSLNITELLKEMRLFCSAENPSALSIPQVGKLLVLTEIPQDSAHFYRQKPEGSVTERLKINKIVFKDFSANDGVISGRGRSLSEDIEKAVEVSSKTTHIEEPDEQLPEIRQNSCKKDLEKCGILAKKLLLLFGPQELTMENTAKITSQFPHSREKFIKRKSRLRKEIRHKFRDLKKRHGRSAFTSLISNRKFWSQDYSRVFASIQKSIDSLEVPPAPFLDFQYLSLIEPPTALPENPEIYSIEFRRADIPSPIPYRKHKLVVALDTSIVEIVFEKPVIARSHSRRLGFFT